MKKCYLYILFTVACPLIAQTNLVPNGGFEEYTMCPSNDPGNAQVYLAIPWEGYSSDFMHTCAGFDPLSLALNAYSNSRNGEGHVRGVSYYSSTYNYREYIEVQLTEPLEVGELYCIEYFCKLQNPNDVGITGIDGMGAFFSENFSEWDDIIYYEWPDGDPSPYVDIIAQAQILSEEIHNDTLNYSIISGNFIADKAYNYVTIGNFVNDDKLNFHLVQEAPPMTITFASYAIDDVAVWKCNDVTLSEQDLLPKLYPIANGFVLKRINKPLMVSIYDMSGRMVHKATFDSQGHYDLSFLPAGLYVYRLNDGNTVLETGKLYCD